LTARIDHPTAQYTCLDHDIEHALRRLHNGEHLGDMTGCAHFENDRRAVPLHLDPTVGTRCAHLIAVDVGYGRGDRSTEVI
jgi:hypothetical protein